MSGLWTAFILCLFFLGGIAHAATIFQTNSSDTLTTFRTNVNSSLVNLNAGLLPTTTPWASGFLIINASGQGYTAATSSLGLLTTNVAEGSNLYFTNTRVQSYLDTLSKGYFFSTTSAAYWITQQTTDTLAEGLTNLYFTNARADARFVADLAATTSVRSITTLPSLSLPYAQLTGTPAIASSTLLGDANSFTGLDKFSNASTTLATISNTLWLTNITGSTQCLHVDTNGKVSGSGSDCSSAGSGGLPFTATTNFNQVAYATTSPTLWFKGGLFGSTTTATPIWFDQIQVGSTTVGTLSTSTIYGNLSVRGNASSTSIWDSSLGTAAGTFIAADPTGKLIATTSPSGGSQTGFWSFTTPTDGSYTLDGSQAAVAGVFSKSGNTYTLLKDAHFSSLVTNSNITLNTGGFRLFVSGTFTDNGTTTISGSDGGAGGSGGSTVNNNAGSAGTPGGSAGSAGSVSGTLFGGVAGFAGQVGGSGASGGGSGSGAAGGTGGTGGATSTVASTTPNDPTTAIITRDTSFFSNNPYSVGGGCGQSGGGGGGGGASGQTSPGSASAGLSGSASALVGQGQLGASGGHGGNSSGGGGGGGGGAAGGCGGEAGIMVIVAKTIAGAGNIWAKGGNGGLGGDGGNSNSGGCGGGGAGGSGGNGGVIILVYSASTFTGNTSVAGGTGGTGGQLGPGGSCNGFSSGGAAGSNGNNGATGIIYDLH